MATSALTLLGPTFNLPEWAWTSARCTTSARHRRITGCAGLAFAGILVDLGFSGTLSVVTPLAFNVGVELAQVVVTLALFPSLYVVARTRWYPAFRTAGCTLALVAAAGWVVERVSPLTSPRTGVEDGADRRRGGSPCPPPTCSAADGPRWASR